MIFFPLKIRNILINLKGRQLYWPLFLAFFYSKIFVVMNGDDQQNKKLKGKL